MLKIIRSGFGAGATQRIANALCDAINNQRQCYLIVPEQQTVMAESEMATKLPKIAPLYFEATNFTRFANTVLRALGGLSGEYCDSGRKSLIMWRTVTELMPKLNLTNRGEINAGIVDQSLHAVAEMENLGITPDDLARSAKMVNDNKRLSTKLSDLALIYALYKELISKKYSDSNDSVNFTAKRLRDKPDYLRGASIYIEGFTSFTEAQYALIGLLAARCDVNVYLPIPKGEKSGFEYKEVMKAESRIKSYAAKEGADVQLKKEDGSFNTTSEILAALPYAIWKLNYKIDNITLQNDEEVRIIEASTPFEECDFIASDIRRRVMDGAKYSDFAIIARSADRYAGMLDGALNGAKIPYFVSSKTDIASLEAVKLIYTAFTIIRNGYRREDVITYAKCGLSGISRDECDELELYTDVWQINGNRFTNGVDWNMNPLGYSTKKPKNLEEKLSRINEIRYRLINPLMVLENDMNVGGTVLSGATALMRFLLTIKLEHNLKATAEFHKSRGDFAAAEEASSVWKMIINALDAMVDVMGDLPYTVDSFLSQLKALFSTVNLGKIPAFVDQVTIGSADMIRLSGKKHVYLIGVNAGEFPAPVGESSYFSDSERAILAKNGLEIEPELEIKGARELFCFSRALAAASESVTLLYAVTDAKFQKISRADVIDKLIKLMEGRITVKKTSDMTLREKLFSAAITANSLDAISDEDYPLVKKALVKADLGRIADISEGNLKNDTMEISKALCDEIYGDKLSLSNTRLESYSKCPLGHFLKYTINLQEHKIAEFDASSIGSFIHGCLENFFKEVRREEISPETLDVIEREKRTKRAAEKYLSTMGEDIKATRTAVKIKRLTKAAIPIVDGLCDEFGESKYRPRFFELSISENNDATPDPVNMTGDDGKTVSVYGIIDRVDTYEDGDDVFVRVMDYKTGKKDFKHDDMEDGKNLQMFLYLKAIMESKKPKFRKLLGVKNDGKIIPGGVIYVKTSLADVKIDTYSNDKSIAAFKKLQTREGMILEGDTNAALIGKNYLPGKGKEDFLFTEDELAATMEKVESSVLKIADGIKSGKAAATPKITKDESSCQYCQFKPFCRNVKMPKK